MLTVTDAAIKALNKHITQWEINAPIRITLMHGACKGDTLHLTLCICQENDLIYSYDNITFLINRNLAERCGPITIDFDKEYERCPCSGHNGGLYITSKRLAQYCIRPGCWATCPKRRPAQEESVSPA